HGAGVSLDRLRSSMARVAEELAVLVELGAHENADSPAAQRGRAVPCVFQGFPDSLEEDAVLGIHQSGFRAGDSEKGRIELVDVRHESAPSDDGLPVRA